MTEAVEQDGLGQREIAEQGTMHHPLIGGLMASGPKSLLCVLFLDCNLVFFSSPKPEGVSFQDLEA